MVWLQRGRRVLDKNSKAGPVSKVDVISPAQEKYQMCHGVRTNATALPFTQLSHRCDFAQASLWTTAAKEGNCMIRQAAIFMFSLL